MFSWRIARIVLALFLGVGLLVPLGTAQTVVPLPDTLVILRTADPQTLDPAWSFDTGSGEWIKNMYLALVELKGASASEFLPAIATEVPTVANGGISADGLTYTFTVREGLLFNSGEPITAEDVEYSLERVMVMDRSGGPSFLLLDVLVTGESFSTTRTADGFVEGIVAKIDNSVTRDGNVVTLHLVKAFAPMLQVIATGAGTGSVVNKSFAVANGAWPGFTGDAAVDQANFEKHNNPGGGTEFTEAALFETVDASGPFQLVSWDRTAGDLLLERNDNFNPPAAEWADVFNQVGPSALGGILARTVPENSARELALQQGTADIATISPRARVPFVAQIPGVRIIDDIPGLGSSGIFFTYEVQGVDDGTAVGLGSGKLDGNGIPPDFFKDDDIREAFTKTFDYDTFIEDVFLGKAVKQATPIISALPSFNPDQEAHRFDLAGAEAAFRRAQGGAVWETGFALTCFHNEGNEARRLSCEVTKAGLETINPNFKMEIVAIPWPVYISQAIDSIMPYWALGWLADFIDPGNYIDQWMTSNGTFSAWTQITTLDDWSAGGSVSLPSGGTFTYANWDELLRSAFDTTVGPDRDAMYFEAQKQFVDSNVALMTHNATEFNAQRTWVNGWYRNPTLSPGLYYGVTKNVNGTPNCAQLAVVGATTSDGSC